MTQNLTVNLDASGNGSITPAEVDNGSSDACGIATLALDKTAFTCADLGANTVTLTVTDNNGNTDTETATITVNDVTAPAIVAASDLTVDCGASERERLVHLVEQPRWRDCHGRMWPIDLDQ